MRRALFWLHLASGVIAGLVIAVLCFTGTALAFEKQLGAWAERDARRVEAPAGATRLSLTKLTQRVRLSHPEAKPTALVVAADPRAAVAFQLGREGALYVNPYTGYVRAPASTRVHDLLHSLEEWHRWLALGGEHRPIGKAITGAANAAFLILAVTGLYLWWPRSWSWRGLRAVAVLNFRLAGKARDWNWHNALGLWSAPVLIVLTLTALPISYRWANNLLYSATGTVSPPQTAGPGSPPPGPAVPPPAPEAQPLPLDMLFAAAIAAQPDWTELTFRLAAPERRDSAAAPRAQHSDSASTLERVASAAATEAPRRRSPQAAAITIRTGNQWPRFASTTLHLDPFTGTVLRTDTFADLPAGRRLRSWARFLHTGEALGWPGQLAAALACAAGLVLAWTGFALAWRRFFRRPVA
ncbi:MAG TPA: PepSY-associated TM helix domain-containing protein [Opitutaceae bacterium]|nr:PepSY-associated TM helix domain-containing protein [Opitutaceae bacterium]